LGDYHKYLLAGTHSIKVIANGYAPKTITQVNVTDKNSTVTNVKLQPLKGHYIYKVVSAAIPGNNPADEGNTPAVIGSPDKVSYSIGKGGTIIVDLQYPAVDNQGNDIKVVEGDASAEGFTCYAGQTMEGPWKSLGTGKGTTDFDLSQSGLSTAQFIKIVDDNDGTANANDAGFELDAIQITDASVTGIDEQPTLADFIAYPNPFNNILTIQYTNETAESTLLNIYNSMGQRVLALTDKEQFIGKHVLQVDASTLSPGIYYCQLQRVSGISGVATYIIKL
ncbi:MAG: T9SS type A sorting domain-containing protein, partial [Bacteroidota bacterium]